MKTKILMITIIALILVSLPGLVLAESPVVPSTSSGPSGDEIQGDGFGSPDALWEQPASGANAIIDQYFSDSGKGVYSADDFSNAIPWMVETIFVDGNNRWSGGGQLTNANNLNWFIYPDAAGVPGSYPGAGGHLWSYSCLPGDPEVTISGVDNLEVTLDIVQAQGTPLYLPPGTYWLCFYPSLDFVSYDQWFWDITATNNFAIAQVIDPDNHIGLPSTWSPWTNIDPNAHDAAFRLDGYTTEAPTPPSGSKYLHSTDGLFELSSPLNTQWHELWPIFCRQYHLSSWEDNGDGTLSFCDHIEMYRKPDGPPKPYHVEEVTITLYVEPLSTNNIIDDFTNFLISPEPMYIELVGGYNTSALMNPVGTQWHEVYPTYCTAYNLTDWADNQSGTLDYCDNILLRNEWTGQVSEWHVEEIAVDIVVTQEPWPVGGEAYPVNTASLLAPLIAMAMVLTGGTIYYFARRQRI